MLEGLKADIVVVGCGLASVVAGFLIAKNGGYRLVFVDEDCCGCRAGDSLSVARIAYRNNTMRNLALVGRDVLRELQSVCDTFHRRTSVLTVVPSGVGYDIARGLAGVRLEVFEGPGVFYGVRLYSGEEALWEPRAWVIDAFSLIQCILGLLTRNDLALVYEYRRWRFTDDGIYIDGMGVIRAQELIVRGDPGKWLGEETVVYSHPGRKAPPAVIDAIHGFAVRPETGAATRIVLRRQDGIELYEKCPSSLRVQGVVERLGNLLDNSMPVARFKRRIPGVAGIEAKPGHYKVIDYPEPAPSLGLAQLLATMLRRNKVKSLILEVSLTRV